MIPAFIYTPTSRSFGLTSLFDPNISPFPVSKDVLGRYVAWKDVKKRSRDQNIRANEMHCIGFKKNVNRATTQVMMKTGSSAFNVPDRAKIALPFHFTVSHDTLQGHVFQNR